MASSRVSRNGSLPVAKLSKPSAKALPATVEVSAEVDDSQVIEGLMQVQDLLDCQTLERQLAGLLAYCRGIGLDISYQAIVNLITSRYSDSHQLRADVMTRISEVIEHKLTRDGSAEFASSQSEQLGSDWLG